ncbi:MAG: Rid family detoxifying hydrolase [Synergistaceae bacterium]|jgi:2-iminobutanoate/2-iminopropanoate deaminase|nr:Rid family detoxifying hydrolase [Synergistaceae bacterium]
MTRKVVNCDQAPPALGAYSQGVWAGDLLFLTGVCGADPKTGEIAAGGIGAETKLAMETAGAMLASEGLSFDDVVNARIYITDFDKFKEMNEVYKSFFNPPYPARATVEVSRLAGGAGVEIVLVAYRGKKP